MKENSISPIDVVRHWINAVNSHDIPGIMETLHDEYEYQFNDSILKGKPDVTKAWQIYLEAIPDLHLETQLLFGSGEFVAARFKVTGTNKGPLKSLHSAGSEIPIPHDEDRVEYNEGEFFRIKDGKIINLWNYWDTAVLK